MKVLCFTTSFNRIKMLRGCIFDIYNQNYDNIHHSINITYNEESDIKIISKLIDDINNENISISFHKNKHQHFNYINSILQVNYNDYDIFVKIDDDDIFKRDYVKVIVDFFSKNKDVDVISSKIKYQLNGSLFKEGDYNNLGGNPLNCDFKMPQTFAFNKKALNYILNLEKIYGFEDHMWRDVWCDNCNIYEIDNTDNIIWNIHGQNISVSNFLIK
jgi:hypothetical protein